MAKLYGEIAAKALLTLDKSFARANGQPLDASEVYYSLAAAQEYAAGAQAYVGQKIVVIEDGVVSHYSVNDEAGTLKELGAKPIADGTTITIGADGKISLANVAEKAEGTYNAVLVNGVLTWVKPSETTVEGLSDLLQALTGRVDGHDTSIKANADAIKAIADDYLKESDKTELADAIAAEKVRAEEAEANLQTQINTIMDNPDAEGAINSINEFTKYVKDHGDIAEGFRVDINKNKDDIAAEAARAAAAEEANANAIKSLEEADTALSGRIDALEEHDHDSYATKEELAPVATAAANAQTAVGNLETRFDEIVAVGGEPNAINKIQVNGSELAIENKTVNIAVPTKASDLIDDTGFDARITAAQNQADKGVNDAAAALTAANQAQGEVDALELVVGGIQTTVAGHTESIADHLARIAELEAADITHGAEYASLLEIVNGHTATIAKKADATALAEVAAKASANESAIDVLNTVTIPGINAAVALKADASELSAYHTKSEIAAIIGDVPADKTVAQMIADAQSAATYDDAAVRQLIADEAARADAAEKANATEIARVNEVLVAALENDAEGLDSIKELADWISKHGPDASDMAKAIEANTAAIEAINHETTGILAQAKAYTDALPAATAEALGLVKYDDSTIKMNTDNQLYVAKVSTDILEQGTQVLVLNGGTATI